jgi:hypothetical protein
MLKKKTALLSVGVTSMLLIFSGCYKTTTLVVNPGASITTEMSYAKDITPIFTKSCALSGCHVAGGKAPDLTKDNSYKSLTGGGYIKAGDPDNSTLYQWLNGKKSPVMPLGAGPDQAINGKVYAWIKQGAKNN